MAADLKCSQTSKIHRRCKLSYIYCLFVSEYTSVHDTLMNLNTVPLTTIWQTVDKGMLCSTDANAVLGRYPKDSLITGHKYSLPNSTPARPPTCYYAFFIFILQESNYSQGSWRAVLEKLRKTWMRKKVTVGSIRATLRDKSSVVLFIFPP